MGKSTLATFYTQWLAVGYLCKPVTLQWASLRNRSISAFSCQCSWWQLLWQTL